MDSNELWRAYFNSPKFSLTIETLNTSFPDFESLFNSNLRNRMLNELFYEGTQIQLIQDDKNSMINSIENRSPFLDSNLVEFVYSLPQEYLINNGIPKFLLRKSGVNIINNIVDITNYTLHYFGQPLHAFDLDKIKGNIINIKSPIKETSFITLDGVERKLDVEDIMICNGEKEMCLAGVFGGLESGVSNTTKNIFIESALFNAISIRKTAKRHGLNTDASFRYERGIIGQVQIIRN